MYIEWFVPPSNSHHQDSTFLVGDPYKPYSFATITGKGTTQCIPHILLFNIGRTSSKKKTSRSHGFFPCGRVPSPPGIGPKEDVDLHVLFHLISAIYPP